MENQKIIAKDFYVYTFFTPLIPKATANQPLTITIQNDSQFLWQKTTFSCDVDPAPAAGANLWFSRVQPLITAQITDTSSGRILFSRETNLGTIAGYGEFPFTLPEPRILIPKTTLQITLSNYSTTDDYKNVFINLIGTKQFLG